MEQSIVSSDSHVIEVPDLWVKGMPAAFKDRAPKAFFDEKRDAWMFGSPEVQIQAVGGLFMAGQQPENRRKVSQGGLRRGAPRRLGSARTPSRHGHRRRRRRSALSELGSRFILRRGRRTARSIVPCLQRLDHRLLPKSSRPLVRHRVDLDVQRRSRHRRNGALQERRHRRHDDLAGAPSELAVHVGAL